jgi:hypothetical protein
MGNLNHTSTPQSITHRIATLDEHRQTLKDVLKTARERVIIISPSVSRYEMRQDDVAGLVQAAVRRGVKIAVVTDDKQNRIDGVLKNVAKAGIDELQHFGARVIILDGIQYKILIKDNDLLVKGNFCWLSAARDGEKVKKSLSVVTGGEAARAMIEDELMWLNALIERGRRARERQGQRQEGIRQTERRSEAAKDTREAAGQNWDPASASPSGAAQALAGIVLAGIVLICAAGGGKATLISALALVATLVVVIGPIVVIRNVMYKSKEV